MAQERARAAGGVLLLRNEDLDPQRSLPEFVAAMVEDLAWLGIAWQPPMVNQSERVELYRGALRGLLDVGAVYPCTCSRREIAQMMQAPHEDSDGGADAIDDEPIYSGKCRPAGKISRVPQAGVNYRFRVPDGEVVRFVDGRMGAQSFVAGRDFGDFLVWRKDGLPSYQLACVVDDAEMQITEVVRGADLLKSTARQILLQRALGLGTPGYFHTELMRDAGGMRLAKRHDALSLRALREGGMTPEQVRGMF